MVDLTPLLVSPDASIRDAVAAIDRGARQVALVVDDDRRLVAVVTDGNIRRGLLKGLGLDAPVADVMTTDPTRTKQQDGIDTAHQMMRDRQLHHMPIVDEDDRLIDLLWIDDLTRALRKTTPVFLMAGGLGMRLRPLTESVPKPMLSVGRRPLLEQILQSFSEQGFVKFILSVNYLGEVIREHFGDGSDFGVEVTYIEESKRMGTAGALSLLLECPDEPVIVMNADLLTSIRFESLLRFHLETGASATICARQFDMQVPYGVIEAEGTRLREIIEKPVHHHFVNAGVYVLSPEVIAELTPGASLDMPELLTRLTERGNTVSVFPVCEYWLDIGRLEDLERARSDYNLQNAR